MSATTFYAEVLEDIPLEDAHRIAQEQELWESGDQADGVATTQGVEQSPLYAEAISAKDINWAAISKRCKLMEPGTAEAFLILRKSNHRTETLGYFSLIVDSAWSKRDIEKYASEEARRILLEEAQTTGQIEIPNYGSFAMDNLNDISVQASRVGTPCDGGQKVRVQVRRFTKEPVIQGGWAFYGPKK